MDSEDDEKESYIDVDGISTEQEDRCVNDFIEKFVIISETSTLGEVNLILAMKVMPISIVGFNIDAHELLNFKIFQDSLIAFQNADIVNAFEYFDKHIRD